MAKGKQACKDGKVLIFRPYFTKPDGTKVYPKGGKKVFPMWVDPERNS